jgi:chaperonin GroES
MTVVSSNDVCVAIHDRIVIKRVDAETKTATGIVIPDNAKEKPQQGEVVAAGPGRRDKSS